MHSVLSYARRHHLALLALFVAMGSGAYAAVQIPAGSVGSKQLKKNSVVSKKVKNRSLLAKDFKRGQLPAGARGPTGEGGADGAPGPPGIQGAQGEQGETGTVDTSNFYDKLASDDRYVQGGGTRIASAIIEPSVDNPHALGPDIPGIGRIHVVECGNVAGVQMGWQNNAGAGELVIYADEAGDAETTVASANTTGIGPRLEVGDAAELHVRVANSKMRATIFVGRHSEGGDLCPVAMTAIYTAGPSG
jgi:hypothetical protein